MKNMSMTIITNMKIIVTATMNTENAVVVIIMMKIINMEMNTEFQLLYIIVVVHLTE